MKLVRILVVAVFCIAMFGCASTTLPNLVDEKQEDDNQLTCVDLEFEYRRNTDTASSKISKHNVANVINVTLDILVWSGIGNDNNITGYEGNALLNRNLWLKSLAKEKKCDFTGWPEQPERY